MHCHTHVSNYHHKTLTSYLLQLPQYPLRQFETYYDRSSLPRPYGFLTEQCAEGNMKHLFAPAVTSMVMSSTKAKPVFSTTQCEVLCTTNTVINWVMEPIEPQFKDTMGVLPFKDRRTNRVTKITKGETPWQKYKMTGARVGRNEEMIEAVSYTHLTLPTKA